MKRIIVTESQYKKLVKRNLNEFIKFNDSNDEYDVTPQIDRFLRILDTNLMELHDEDTYVKKIEKGVVEIDSDKYEANEKETINSIIDWWVSDTKGTEDKRTGDLTYDSGIEWEYKGEIEPEIVSIEKEIEPKEKEIEVDTTYLTSWGIPKLGSETYGFKEGKLNTQNVFKGGDNGDWGGSMGRALWFAKVANDYMGRNILSSQKRTRKTTKSKKISDHYEGERRSYAVDLAISGSKGDELLGHIMSIFANGDFSDYKGGHWFNKTIDGYRYQIGWKSDSDHYDHIHVGVRKV